MIKRLAEVLIAVIFCLNICGCFALFAGAAGGAGTAVWLSGKLTQQLNASYDRTIKATESALESLDLAIIKESKEADVATFRSQYTDGKEIWIDVRRITDVSTKVEVRVGWVGVNKIACDKILNKIKSYL